MDLQDLTFDLCFHCHANLGAAKLFIPGTISLTVQPSCYYVYAVCTDKYWILFFEYSGCCTGS